MLIDNRSLSKMQNKSNIKNNQEFMTKYNKNNYFKRFCQHYKILID